jgi:opacity protein-like surface antigen
MKKLLAVAAFALALAAPAAASAQEPFLGFRIGYGFPYGTAFQLGGADTNQSDLVKAVIPLQMDLGFRMGPTELSGYFSYGFGQAPSSCPGSCSENVIRVGGQAVLHAALRAERELWGGVLLGWERTHVSPGTGADASASGWEGGLEGGYDFVNSTAGFGPFVQLTAGKYSSIDLGGTSLAGFDKTWHGTFLLGVRGHFRL